MRWPSLVLIIWCLSAFSLNAQDIEKEADPEDVKIFAQTVDSLQWLIGHGKVAFYPTGCSFPVHKNQYFTPSGVAVSQQALSLTKRTRLPYIYVYALSSKASRLYNHKNYEAANRIWEKILQITIENGFHFEELHMCRQALNNTNFLSGNYAEAMKISSDGLHRAQLISDWTMMAHFNNVIGYIHMRQKNFPEASNYFTDYLQLTRLIKDSVLEGHALYNLADLYLAKRSYDSALIFLDKALYIYRSAASSPLRRFDLKEREGYISNKIAQAWALKGNYDNAFTFNKVSLESAKALSGINAYDKAEYYIRAGEIHNHLHQPDSAIYYTQKGLGIARQIIHREHTMYGYEQLALAFAEKNQFESAWAYQVMFQKLKDTITGESSQRDILLRETSLSIEREKVKQAAVMERQRFWRNIIICLAVFMMIITWLLYNRYRLKEKNRLQAELNRQQSEIIRTTIEVQDKERRRIAEDLHDSLGSILSAAKLKLSSVEATGGSTSNPENEKLNDALLLLDEAINEMKSIAYNIMPATLSRLGLIAALQNLFTRISSRAALKLNFSTHGFNERLDQLLEVSIYRIVLESINNVVKHANAGNVTVQLIRYPDYINITIEDDGKGFRQALEQHGNGLANIDSRVRNLGGRLDIDSTVGSGTTILVDIPYRNVI
jgi:two-component system, NarL family, sensor kinase